MNRLTGNFTDYVKEHIDSEDYNDVINYGMDTGWNGFIYSNEMREVYFHYRNEIESMLDDLEYKDPRQNMGINELIDNRVWACAYHTVCLLKEEVS